MTPETPYPNTLLLQFTHGIIAVLGQKGLDTALKEAQLTHLVGALPADDLEAAISVGDYARLQGVVARLTGRASKRLLQRIGREAFQWGIAQQTTMASLANLALKAMPTRLQQQAILLGLRRGLTDLLPTSHIELKSRDNGVIYLDHTCPICQNRETPEPCCHYYVGYLQAVVQFATDRDATVTETLCRAQSGVACRFEIEIQAPPHEGA